MTTETPPSDAPLAQLEADVALSTLLPRITSVTVLESDSA